ncbi:hypothetical protein Htur_1878 [Haloterrigena turkmenica DSM 5511]|uniref:Uncharacterized protein n=1 Tax=Haloterrigena turkmenica (strain ATCC 51198 / DSM 5511 / JCM 9101 / NCIMB 13204 / VKM B-1734 / 4k) TaxID=543526 RepID=D2RSI7_HALTV|nr:hypothetical protein [Haloterrigena turkmenica]ADB60763.1 hypothetical protein Htur_1878 [Haloterrigena turkmenica DSM 5511]
MRQDTSGSTTRRTFVKCGLLSSGALVGTSSTGTADGSRTESTESAVRPIEQGVMRSYQHIPNSAVTVGEAVDWRPQGLDEAAGRVVSYDAAPSFRALLFTTAGGGGDGDDGNDNDGGSGPDLLQPGGSLSLGSVRGSPETATSQYVTVDLEVDETVGSTAD